MKYDFTTLPDRSTMSSGKWGSMKRLNPAVPAGIAPMSTADMDLLPPPQLVEGLKDYVGSVIFGYTRPWDSYNQAVADWMQTRHNWKIEKDWIVPTPGIVPALFDGVLAYTQPNDGVIILTPVYHPFYGAIRSAGRTIVESPLIATGDSYQIDFADFEKKAQDKKNTLLIFCSPHNPIGRVWTREELEKIADICLKNNVTIMCDEIHHDLIMPGYEHTVMADLSPEIADITVTFTAASKSFNIAGLQTSNVIISNPELREKLREAMNAHSIHGGNMMGYKATEIVYTQCADWLDECIDLIWKNYNYVRDYCEKNIPEVKVKKMEGTYLPWIDMNGFGLDEKTLEKELAEKALIFGNMGSMFGTAGNCFLRITLVCPYSVIVETMDRLGKWAESLRK